MSINGFRSTACAVLIGLVIGSTVAGPVRADEVVGFDMQRLQAWSEIESLAWPLKVAAAPGCNDPSWHTGLELLASPAQGMFVRSISRGSPADGQLEVDDRVVALNGRRFHADGVRAYEDWMGGLRENAATSSAPQRWTVSRHGTEHTFELSPVQVCHVEIFYASGNVPSILRRENMVIFTPALQELAPEPWMIQAQIAHDLGHRLGQHEKQTTRTSRWAGVAGNIVGALGGPDMGGAAGHVLNIRRRPQQEIDADRAGIDLALSIGLDEAQLIQYWVDVIELQTSAGGGSGWLGAHPAHPSRITALQERFDAMESTPESGS